MRRLSLTLGYNLLVTSLLNNQFRLRTVILSLSQVSWGSSCSVISIVKVNLHTRLGVSNTVQSWLVCSRHRCRPLRVKDKVRFLCILRNVIWIPIDWLLALRRVGSTCHCATSVLVLDVSPITSLRVGCWRRLHTVLSTIAVDQALHNTVLLVLLGFDELLLLFIRIDASVVILWLRSLVLIQTATVFVQILLLSFKLMLRLSVKH